MIKKVFSALFLFGASLPVFGQAAGALQVGDILPDRIFTEQRVLQGNLQLNERLYSTEFEGKAILLLYYASF